VGKVVTPAVQAAGIGSNVTVTGGQEYRVRVKLKRASGCNLRIALGEMASPNEELTVNGGASPSSTGYTEYSGVVTPSRSGSYRLYVRTANNPCAATTFYVDAVSVTEVNPGTYTGGYTLDQAGGTTDGDGAVRVNGSTGYVTVPDAAALNFASALSVEAWVKPVDQAANQSRRIVAKPFTSTATPYNEFSLNSNAGAAAAAQFEITTGGTRTILTGTTTLPSDRYSHVVGTWDGTTMRIYVNGVLESSVAKSGTLNNYDQPLQIGRLPGGWYFNGWIDDVGLYSKALTTAQVAQRYRGFEHDWKGVFDNGAPTLDAPSHGQSLAGWFGGSASLTATLTGHDTVSGVNLHKLFVPGEDVQTRDDPCTDAITNLCPLNPAAQTFNYSTARMPEGSNTVRAVVEDAAGNVSSARTWTVKVDRSKPTFEAEGPFVDNVGQPYGEDDEYELWIDADDAHAGVTGISVKVDGNPADSLSDPCDPGGCSLDDYWDFRPADYSVGSHTVQLTVTDGAGNTATNEWVVMVERPLVLADAPEVRPSPIVVAGDGGTAMQETCTSEPASSDADLIVNGGWMGGTQSTEYWDDGTYRVSRCNATGDFLSSQTVADTPVPGGAIVALPVSQLHLEPETGDLVGGSWLYPDPADPVWAGDWAATGAALRDSVIAPNTVGGMRPMTASATVDSDEDLEAAANACARGDFKTQPGKPTWEDNEYDYTINPANLPGSDRSSRAMSRKRMFDGHRTWNQTLDRCKNKKTDKFFARYQGTSDHSIGNNEDGHNTRAFSTGKIVNEECPSKEQAIACNIFRIDRNRLGPDYFKEVDIVFDGRDRWWNRLSTKRCEFRYDIWNVATHEVGHSLGLAHVKNRRSVMWGDSRYCDGIHRVLGQMDVQGVRYLYGG
jgi:hypothetical protein